ncbi:M48 family metallopeptidase [Spirabiliibacterium falconis]|uniref:M48 family metallopeptidase n=1 Tax=Spirabiliibacterium falconis TaxID=572023 RepID=UPI001AADAEFC|nr:M48 family metallopeptidase [Spirabiliibacterium falconis]MBE2893968.1 M48 family metallopeptidase [Spirabiliibacterium falconis]
MRKQFWLTALLAMGIVSGCADTRSVNQEAANSYTQAVQQMRTQGMVDTSSTTAKRIHRVFARLKPIAQQENQTGVPFDWEITVMKNKELNAWAMPGGKMMFYTGLVDRLQLNDNEIATVMGHEMAHALKEHGKQSVNFTMATGILAEISSVAVAAVTGVDFRPVIGLTQEYGLNKPFSRSNETEADEVGLMLMAKAGYNPEAAPHLWEKMSQATGSSGNTIESILSTHPTNADRQANLKRLLPQAMALYQQANKAN